MSADEWDLFDILFLDLTTDLLQDSSIIFLDYSLPTLMQRIKKRGRDYELEMYTDDYLAQLQKGLEALVSNLRKQGVEIIHLSEEKAGDFENDEVRKQGIIEIVKKQLKK